VGSKGKAPKTSGVGRNASTSYNPPSDCNISSFKLIGKKCVPEEQY